MVREKKVDFKAHAREEAAGDMVNVNTQVSSSMELPFGEYTCFFILMIGEKNRQPLGSSAFWVAGAVAAAALNHQRLAEQTPFVSAPFTRP